MDITQLSDEDLKALHAGDISKVSDAGIKTLYSTHPGDAEAPDERGTGTKLLQGAGKTLDALTLASPLKAALAKAAGYPNDQIGAMMDPRSGKTIGYPDIMEKAGFPEAGKFSVGKEKPGETTDLTVAAPALLRNLAKMRGGFEFSGRDALGNMAEFAAPSMIQKGVVKGLSQFPALLKYLQPAAVTAKGVQGASTVENVMNPLNVLDRMNKGRQANKSEALYQKAFKYPQLALDTSTTIDKEQMIPLWQQAQASGFKGSMQDFLKFIESQNSQAGKEIGAAYSAVPDAKIPAAPLMNFLKGKQAEFKSSLVPGIQSEAAPLNAQVSNVEGRLKDLGGPVQGPLEAPKPIIRKDIHTGADIHVGTQPAEGLGHVDATTLPIDEAERLYKDINKGVGYNKPLGSKPSPSEDVLKQAVRVQKDAIQGELPEDIYENLMDANKRFYSTDENVQKAISPYARLKSEDPMLATSTDKLVTSHGPMASLAKGEYGKAAIQAAGLALKKKGDYQKATKNITGRAFDLKNASEMPVDPMGNSLKGAALIRYLKSLGEQNGEENQ